MVSVLGFQTIQTFTHFIQQQGVVLTIFRSGDIGLQTTAARVFPVKVDAIKHRVLLHEINDRLRKSRPTFCGRRHIGEGAGQGPATDGNHGLQLGIGQLQLSQLVKITSQCLIPGIGNAIHTVCRIKGFFCGGIGVKEAHTTGTVNL